MPPAAQLCLDALDGQSQLLTVPSVKELLENDYPHFEYKETYETGRWDPVWVM